MILRHRAPRVKVELPNGDLIPFSIRERPTILLKGAQLAKAVREIDRQKMKPVFTFIYRHRDLMLRHWHGDISDMELLRRFPPENIL